MILEFYKGKPLMFQVGNDDMSSTTILYEAMASAIDVGAKQIKVIAVGIDEEKVIDTLDVDDTLQKFFGFLCAPPLQYEYVATGGMLDVVWDSSELADEVRTMAYE